MGRPYMRCVLAAASNIQLLWNHGAQLSTKAWILVSLARHISTSCAYLAAGVLAARVLAAVLLRDAYAATTTSV